MTIYEYMEDHDNPELNEGDWDEQMEYAVHQYNEEFEENYKVKSAISNYKSWKRENDPNLTEPRE